MWLGSKKKKRDIDPAQAFEYIKGRHDYKLMKLCAENQAHDEPKWLELNHDNWSTHNGQDDYFYWCCKECRKILEIKHMTSDLFYWLPHDDYIELREKFVQAHRDDPVNNWLSSLWRERFLREQKAALQQHPGYDRWMENVHPKDKRSTV